MGAIAALTIILLALGVAIFVIHYSQTRAEWRALLADRRRRRAQRRRDQMKNVMLILGLVTLTLLSGCSMFLADRPQVALDYGTACLTYADTKSNIAVMEVRVVDMCGVGTLSPKVCADLERSHDRLKMADMYVRDLLKNPKQPVDWEKVNAFLQDALGIAIRLGLKL